MNCKKKPLLRIICETFVHYDMRKSHTQNKLWEMFALIEKGSWRYLFSALIENNFWRYPFILYWLKMILEDTISRRFFFQLCLYFISTCAIVYMSATLMKLFGKVRIKVETLWCIFTLHRSYSYKYVWLKGERQL